MSLEEAGDTYARFFESLIVAMMRSAEEFVEISLAASPTIDPLLAILNANGVFHPDQIDRRGKCDLVHPSNPQAQPGNREANGDDLLSVIRTALGIHQWEQIEGMRAILNANGVYRWEQIDDSKPGWLHPKELARRSQKADGRPIDPILAILNASGLYLWAQLDDSRPGWTHPATLAQVVSVHVDQIEALYRELVADAPKLSPAVPGAQTGNAAVNQTGGNSQSTAQPAEVPTGSLPTDTKPTSGDVGTVDQAPASDKPTYTNRIGERIEYLPNGIARVTDTNDGTSVEGPEAEIEAAFYGSERVMSGEFAEAETRYPELKNHGLAIELTDVVESLVDVLDTIEPHLRPEFMRNAIDAFMEDRRDRRANPQALRDGHPNGRQRDGRVQCDKGGQMRLGL